MLGHKLRQLCAPLGRRDHILTLAYDTVFGSHMAYRKTKERIRLSFWWPKLSKDVAEYCMPCTSCQQRRRKVATDRVPISQIPRAQFPFQHITMDCIGPSDPPSSKGHKCCEPPWSSLSRTAGTKCCVQQWRAAALFPAGAQVVQ